MKKIMVMVLAMVAGMPSVSTAHMRDVSEETSSATMLPLGDIKSDWEAGTEKELMELLKTKDKVRVLRIMKKLCLDELSDRSLSDILYEIRMQKLSEISKHYPSIYLFYQAGKHAQKQKEMLGTVSGVHVELWVRAIPFKLRKDFKDPTQTELKLMEQEAWDYINSL